MDASLKRRSGAFLSSRSAAVTVKAFSGSNGSCTPQVADKVSSSATLMMA